MGMPAVRMTTNLTPPTLAAHPIPSGSPTCAGYQILGKLDKRSTLRA